MFQVIRQEQLFLGAWNYESQTQQLVVWPRTVAHSRVIDWAIMGNGPFYIKITSKMLNIFSVINRPNKKRIGWICHTSNKRIDPNKTV